MRLPEHAGGRFGSPRLALLLASICACGDAQNNPSRGLGAVASASSSLPSTCDEGASSCVDEASRTVCRAGHRVPETCAAGSMCVTRSCVALALPNGTPLARERVRTMGREGFLNAWSIVTPLGKRAVDGYLEHLDPSLIGGEKAFRATCARDGYVTPRSRGVDKTDGPIVSVASGVLVSEEKRRVRLFASVSGKLRVLFGASEALSIEELRGIDKRPLFDEQSAEIELAEGATDVTVVLEAPADAERIGGFYLRLRELDGSALRGVVFAERFDACSPSTLLDAGADVDIDKTGLLLHLDPVYRGLEPIAPKPWPIDVDVVAAGKSVTTVKIEAAGASPIAMPKRGGFDITAHMSSATEPLFARSMPGYGDLVGRVSKLVEGVLRARAASSLPAGSRDSFEMHVRSLVRLIARGDPDLAFLERHTKLAEHLLERLDHGEDPYAGETGVVYRAYRSALDGQLQPYVAFVPKSQSKAKSQPLVLVSHGRDRLPEHALRTLIGEAPDDHMTLRFAERNLPAFPDQNALLAAPYGYDEGGPHPLGEDDLLRVVSEMSAAYKVDARRVSLTGYSLGGTVAFVAPLHHPDVFSAAAPLCGYPNLLGYASVANAKRAPWEDALLAKKYIVNYADNGEFLPLHVVHGGKDGPGRSKVVVDRYKALDYSYIFDVQDDLDHDVWDYAYEDGRMVSWLSARSRPASPKHVRFVTGEYRYDRAYWLRIIGLKDASDPALASVDARLVEKTKRVEITSRMVTSLALERDTMEPRSAWADAFTIGIDGENLEIPAGKGPVFLERGDHWSRLDAEPSREGLKRHGVSGPLDDVLRHPITVVYGTRIPAHLTANRLVAEHMAHAGGIAQVTYPVLADTEAEGDALAGRSLVLIGSPGENLLTSKFADALPVKFESDAIVVHGQRFEGPNVAISFIAPRPHEANEYVVVHAGLSETAILASRFLPRYLPDFVVYDGRVAVERFGLLFEDRPFLAGGFFSERWD